MRQDQLERARQARWRQDGNALLTLDDAERWLSETPLCLYLPRRVHLPVPAPSLVEAIAGRADATPGPERIAAAEEMLARLVASGAVIALNLLGTGAGFVGEQPDFLATPEALPYLYALQPERNPKRAPVTAGAGRVSPLAAEIWKILEREGALTADELRSQLGREITEAAVLRALAELWHTMRVVPIPAERGAESAHGAHWELLSSRHRRELNVGSTQSQTTALSILASFYLQSAVAATAEEVEIFLSPVASRSRIRDVVHGLSTTRQLASFPLNGDGHLYVEGSLPEVAEDEALAADAALADDAALAQEGATTDAGLEQNEPSFAEASGISITAQATPPPAAPHRRPYTPRSAFGDRARGSFAARTGGPGGRRASGDRPPRREGTGGFRKPAAGGFQRRPAGAGADRPRSTAPRTDRPRSERPPRTNRFTSSGAERRPAVGFRGPRPGAPQAGAGEAAGLENVPRPSFARGAGRPPFRSAGARPQGGYRKTGDSAGRPARPAGSGFAGSKPRFDRGPDSPNRPARPGSPAKPFRKREEGGDRPRSFARPSGEGRPPRSGSDRPFKKPYAPRTDRPTGDRPFKKPYAPRSGGSAGGRPFSDRPRGPRPAPGDGEGTPRRSYTPRPEGGERSGGRERRPYTPRTGAAPRGKGPGAGFAPRAGGRPSYGAARPGVSRPTGPRPEGGASRERSPRPNSFSKPGGFSKGPGKPGGFKKAGGSFGKPGGFSKSGGLAKRFGAPRPGGASAGRPPSKGGFSGGAKRLGSARPGSTRPDGARFSGPRSGGARPGGFTPPRRKPRSEAKGDEG